MKKTLIVSVITAIVLVLSACSGVSRMNPDRLNIDKAYKFSANMQYGEFNVKAHFERANAERWEITLMEPFALAGMILVYENGEITASFENLQTQVTGATAIYALIIAAFENAVNGEGREVVSYGEEIKITSRLSSPLIATPAYSYTLILDKKRLEPVSLKIPDASLTVEFSQVQVSQIVQVLLPGDVGLQTAATTAETHPAHINPID